MNRQQLEQMVLERYEVAPDYPWQDDNAVLRHPNSQKWFGIVMRLRYAQLGLCGSEAVDVLNVKCDPVLIGAMRQKPGIHPAYHMNKEHWLSIRLDGSASDADIAFLVEQSWQLTDTRRKERK